MLVDTGKAQMNLIIGRNADREAFVFCLYTNTVVWAHDTTIGDVTEAAWSGYARQSTGPGSWNTPTLNASFQAVSLGTELIYANGSGSPQTAKGFFVLGGLSNVFYGGAPFLSPLVIADGTSADFYSNLLTDTIP